ncbi:MAG: LCP family protein [Candidatus Microsaccharimonas sp.]
MNNKKPSVDGFIARRSGSQIGDLHSEGSRSAAKKTTTNNSTPRRRQLRSEDDLFGDTIGVARPGKAINRTDIDASLSELDTPDQKQSSRKLSRRERKKFKKEHRTRAQKIRRRIVIGVVLLVVAALLAVGGYLVYKALNASENVLNGSFIDLIQHEPLKEDENGRSNFLIVGTSEDDPGHQGANLTDSIMILSINQTTKDAYTFSIPRDLEVEFGQPCVQGYYGKINEYFSCSDRGTDDAAEQNRLAKTQALIGDVVGMDIQYGVHVNYTVMRDVVNAIGGSITVTIESRNPNGQMDSNFDWKCGASYAVRIKNCPPNGHFIDYPNGPATLDAEHALYLAQARGDAAPTYGFEQSNFDRERNQQKILLAIREKALSTGTLTNLGSVTGLIDALGNNLRTNIQTKEIQTLMTLAKDIPSDKIQSIDLHDGENAVLNASAQPIAGQFSYGPLRAFLKKQLSSDPFVKEAPNVTVLNGSGVGGVAQTLANTLEEKGFTVLSIANAPEGTYDRIEIYQINKDKTATATKLKELYGVTLKTDTPPVSVNGESDFVIIIGDAAVVQ